MSWHHKVEYEEKKKEKQIEQQFSVGLFLESFFETKKQIEPSNDVLTKWLGKDYSAPTMKDLNNCAAETQWIFDTNFVRKICVIFVILRKTCHIYIYIYFFLHFLKNTNINTHPCTQQKILTCQHPYTCFVFLCVLFAFFF